MKSVKERLRGFAVLKSNEADEVNAFVLKKAGRGKPFLNFANYNHKIHMKQTNKNNSGSSRRGATKSRSSSRRRTSGRSASIALALLALLGLTTQVQAQQRMDRGQTANASWEKQDDRGWGRGESADFRVSERGGEYTIVAQLPGARKEDIEVTVDNSGTLYILCDSINTVQNKNTNMNERDGRINFEKTVTLPRDAKLNNIKAEFREGVLTVRIEREDEVKPRKISVG